jgi:hypothetical protein
MVFQDGASIIAIFVAQLTGSRLVGRRLGHRRRCFLTDQVPAGGCCYFASLPRMVDGKAISPQTGTLLLKSSTGAPI